MMPVQEGAKGRRDASSPLIHSTMVVLAGVSLAVPVNFVDLAPAIESVSRVAILGGALLGAFLLMRKGTRLALVIGGPLLLLAATNSLGGGDPVASVLTIAPVLVGVGLSLAVRGRCTTLVTVLLVTNALSLVVDRLAMGRLPTIFGTPLLPIIEASLSRARGLVGSAVPSAMISVYLCVACLVLLTTASTPVKRRLLLALALLTTVVALFLTGTRSALILLLLMLVVVLLAVRRRKASVRIVHPATVFAALVGLIVVTLSAPLLLRSLETSRLFEFADIAGSESVVNRLYSGAILQAIAQDCDLPCLILGSGPRDLQAVLLSSLGILGLATIDNMFVTLLWDFGLAGVVVIGGVLVYAARTVFGKGFTVSRRAGAVAVISIVLSFAAYDALYVRPVLLLLGVFLVMMLTSRKPAPDAEEHASSVAMAGALSPPRLGSPVARISHPRPSRTGE